MTHRNDLVINLWKQMFDVEGRPDTWILNRTWASTKIRIDTALRDPVIEALGAYWRQQVKNVLRNRTRRVRKAEKR